MTVTVSYVRNIIHPAFQSNSFTPGDQDYPSLLGTASGEFVSAYNTTESIALEWYDQTQSEPSGSPHFPAQGPTEPVHAPSPTQLHTGNVLVVWEEHEIDDRGIRGRLYTANGTALGNELALANVIPPNIPTEPEVAGLRDGGFALTYTMGHDVLVTLFNDNGTGSILPGPSPTGIQTDSAIAALADGGFVVTYTQGAGGSRVFGRLFNADGSVRKADFLIDDAAYDPQSEVAALPNGNWAVVWNDTTGGTGSSLQIFNPAGDPVTGVVHTLAANLADPEITVLPNGFIVTSWSFSEGPAQLSIYGRVFDQEGQPIELAGSVTSAFAFSNNGSGTEGLSALAAVGPVGKFVASWGDYGASDGSGERITSLVSELVRYSTGDGANDTLTGDALNDVMQGGGGNDSFRAGGGTNTIDGGAGTDTAIYDFALAHYEVYVSDGHLTVEGVKDSTAPSHIDTLNGIEQLQFSDGTLAAEDGDGLFDTFFYMAHNPDVFHAGVDAITHYNTFGWREGRDPNELFDTTDYLAANPDVAAAGVNPLEHYRQFGWKEGRDPSAMFDTARYLIDHPDAAAAGLDPLTHFLTVERGFFVQAVGPIKTGFDAQYYLFHNPDVAAAGVDPLQHFNTSGWHEHRNPNGWFDTQDYLSHNPDVAAAGVNPLEHYLMFGWKEGRDASDRFHTAEYLAANPDVAAAGVNPLEHFLMFGFYENRAGVDYGLWG